LSRDNGNFMHSEKEKSISESFIRQLNNGDEQAFRIIYNKMYAKVYRFAYALTKRRDQSEEVVQETFLRLWLHRADVDATRSLDAFLFTIARRLVIDMMRNATSTAALRDSLWSTMQKENHATEETILENNLAALVDEAVAQLPAQQQLIFKLSRDQGLTHEEIAIKLGISKNTVKNHLVSALKTLKVKLARHGFPTLLIFILFFAN
jgi:RNA polymerase sigma-70 factor, Bacteroides expansion family 1